VDACISDVVFPVAQECVLRLKVFESPSFKGIVLDIFNPGFDLTLMTRSAGTGRKDDYTVMTAECPDLRIKLRIEPIGVFDGGFEVLCGVLHYVK